MMGEFILYYRGKIVGGIYDDRLLVKKTRSALELMPAAICELPYEGAKEMLLVDEVDSKVFLTELFEAMVNGYGYHLPDRIIKPAKTVQTPTAGVLFLWVCRDSREAAQGVQPLVAAKPPMSVRGGSKLLSLCADKPSAERTRPQGCISAPLVPKGFSACRSLCSFFQRFPRWFTRQGKPEKCCGFLVGHVLCFRHNAFKDRAPDNKAVAARSAFLFG